MGALYLQEVVLVLLGYFGLGLVLAHRAQENELVVVFFDELSLETNALWMVPIALILALDVLFVVVLAEAKAESLLAISWLLPYNKLVCLLPKLHFSRLVHWLLLGSLVKITPGRDHLLFMVLMSIFFFQRRGTYN